MAESELSTSDKKERKLRLLTYALTNCDTQKGNSGIKSVTDIKMDGPLGRRRVDLELCRVEWENSQRSIRPLRPFSAKINQVWPSSEQDKRFRKYARDNDVPVKYVQHNHKIRCVKLKSGVVRECDSWKRYDNYKKATTLREAVEISCATRDKRKMSLRVARAQAVKDIAWDYEHGFIMFPGNESGRDGHWVDAEMVARDYGLLAEAIKFPGPQTLTAYVSELEREILNLSSISETPSKFGTRSSLAEVLRNQYPEENALKFFDDKHAVAHLAQSSLNELKMQHPVTKKWHGTPKNVSEAMSINNDDKHL